MIYTTGLDSLIFSSGNWEADELVVVSGYIGPNPVQRCLNLPFEKVTVLYGMVSSEGVAPADHQFFKASSDGGKVSVRYCTNFEVHSKLYLWSLGGRPKVGLVGSANFTWPGLNSSDREILSDIAASDLPAAQEYVNRIIRQSPSCLDPAAESFIRSGPSLLCPPAIQTSADSPGPIAELSLLDSRTGEVPERSGINWGHADANVNPNDAYLPISVGMIRSHPGLIPPRMPSGNYPVELLWDDGEVMVGYLEGSQPIDGAKFPKQIASHPSKYILGKYLRKRLGVDSESKVTNEDLVRHGRSTVSISLLGPGRYFLDFRAH